MATPLSHFSPRYDAVLFDLDATLLDTESQLDAGIAAVLLSRHSVIVDPHLLHALRGASDLGPGSWTAAILERYDLAGATTAVALYDAVYTAFNEEMPHVAAMAGAEAVVAGLAAAGMPMAIVTSSTRDMVTRKRSGANAHLFSPVSAIVDFEDVAPRPKPAPDCYLLAAARLGVDITRCLVVEDSVPGVTAGVASGATVVAVPAPTAAARAGVVAAGAHVILHSLVELLERAPEPHVRVPVALGSVEEGCDEAKPASVAWPHSVEAPRAV